MACSCMAKAPLLNTLEEALILPVQKCSKFREDPQFSAVKRSYKRTGGRALIKKILGVNKEPISVAEMDTVFFHNDRFELIVDARGYNPQDIRCSVTGGAIEIDAQKQEIQSNVQRTLTMSRAYQLPQPVSPERGSCFLSADGVLVLSVPWKP